MGDDVTPSPAFSAHEQLAESLRARVVDAVHLALAECAPDERARAIAVVDEALQEHAREIEGRLLRVERLASAGQMSAGVAHELRNPLAVIETSLFILNERLAGDDRSLRHLRRITEQVATSTAIVNDILDTVRDRPLAFVAVDLADVARDALARVARPSNIALSLELSTGLALVDGDPRRLTQVLVNLIANAVQALGARPDARLTLAATLDDRHAALTVGDNGSGIADDALPRLFDPLFSTRSDGTGLGLALSRRIVEAHGGTLTAANNPTGGATFTLRIPHRTS